jgi:hypothetical protein
VSQFEIQGFLDIAFEIHNNDDTRIQNRAGKIRYTYAGSRPWEQGLFKKHSAGKKIQRQKKIDLRELRSNPAFGGPIAFGKKGIVLKDRTRLSCYRKGGKSDEKI